MPERAQRYSLTWKVTPDLLGILSDSGRFEHTNPAWQKTLGLKPEEIESREFFDFIHPDDIARTRDAFVRMKLGHPILNFENRYRHSDGSYRWLSWNAVPEGGLYYCSARDITEHKETAEALQVSETAARFREQFIAVLGHDLRNPLAAIASANRMMRREAQSATTLELLDATQGAVDRMAALIDDLMDFARSQLGQGISVDLNGAAPLKPLLEQAVTEIALTHPDARIETVLEFADPLTCDPDRIAQLLSNLLSNAITHGDPKQPICVRAEDRNGAFVLTVTNSGPPIPEKAIAMLFQPFFRAKLEGSQKGLGLGLFIATEIAKAHGGSLTVASDTDATVFTFEMPRQ